jgi:hypothetical protein
MFFLRMEFHLEELGERWRDLEGRFGDEIAPRFLMQWRLIRAAERKAHRPSGLACSTYCGAGGAEKWTPRSLV